MRAYGLDLPEYPWEPLFPTANLLPNIRVEP